VESWRVLGDLAAGAGPSRLKAITPEPERATMTYRVAGRGHLGDLYRPRTGVRAAVVVPAGAAQGKDDPRLVAFATTLARARFMVLVPEIPTLRALRVAPKDIGHIADAVRYLAEARRSDGVTDPIGVVAISYAAGPALLAVLEPDLRAEVRFLVAVGGYYDIEAVVAFFTTGSFREGPEEPWQRRTPNAYGKWLFVRANAERLSDPRDRVLLTSMAERKLRDPNTEIADLVAALGPEGQSVQALLANENPADVPALIARLPAAIRADMAALDVKRHDLSRLTARLILIHGRDDAIIPYSESLALAAAAPPGQVTLYLVDHLAHVKLGPGGLMDGLRLWRAVYRLLEERDRAG